MRKISTTIKSLSLLIFLGLVFSGQACSLKTLLYPGGDSSKLTLKDIPTALAATIQWFVIGAGSVALIFFLVGGYFYITAFGNEEKAELGKKTLIYALIGAILVLSAYAIVKFFLGLAIKEDVKVFP